MWNLKYGTKERIYENRHTDIDNILVLPSGRVLGEGRSGSVGLADVVY